jgi:hypothetical protein
MLKGNLSNRPFYNQRLISVVVAVIAIVALGLTAFNGWELYTESKARADLRARIVKDQGEATRIQREAETQHRLVDPKIMNALAANTREANTLIDLRTFSWTIFFGLIEKAMPYDARLVAVSPRIEKKEFRVALLVASKTADDVAALVKALEATGAFYDILPGQTTVNDQDGTIQTLLDTSYYPPSAGSRPAKPAGKGRP